jgi:hypothetical protein
MTKFSALSIARFFEADAVAGRVARKAKFVVLVEADDGSWCELDADDQGHAGVLARNWVDTLGARGASCWRVFPGGTLDGRPFFTHYETANWEAA